MATKTNRDRQADLKERRRRMGLVQRTYWVTPEQDSYIVKMLESTEAKDKRARLEAEDRRAQTVKSNLSEIRRRFKAGEKATAIAKWLADDFGWEGTGATLNGLVKRHL